MGYLVPIIMLLGLGIMAYYMTKGSKQQTTWLKELANQHGWNSKTKTEGAKGVYQLSGTSQQGIDWLLNAFSRSSAEDRNVIVHNSRDYMEWTCKMNQDRGELLVMPRDPSWKQLSDDQILGYIKPSWKAMGLPADQFISFSETSKTIVNSYMIYTTNYDLAKKILTPDLINLLTKWQEEKCATSSMITVRISSKEISLHVGSLINKPEEAVKLIEIGEKVSGTFIGFQNEQQ